MNDKNKNSNSNRAIELSKILKDEQEWLRTRKQSQSTLIIVSLELPVKVVRLEKTELINEGDNMNSYNTTNHDESENYDKKKIRFGLKSSQHSLMRTLHKHRNELAKTVKFIGWPGIHIEKDDEKEEIRELLESIDCVPVFPPEIEFKSFNEFCQLFLWPLFHNVLNPEELSNAPFDHEQWRRYHQMNMLWSSVITPIISPEHMDMVWINDYHLLLLCQYLTRKIKGVNIGLFLHIPFPSFEIFRCLPVREELLRSILMADLIGFHFFPYAKQFLSSCKRLLGLDHYFKPGGLIGIDKTTASSRSSVKSNNNLNPEFNKQETVVRIGHVHIQCDDILQNLASNQEILKRSLEIRNRYKDHYIFVSIDRLDQLSGLQLKLKAFDNFLQNYPYIKEEQPVVLIQYIFPTNTLTLEKREKLIQSLITLSKEINLKHSSSGSFRNPVIELKYGPITQEEKYSLFLSGDCLFDTSVRDGLNLNPFEYIICKDDSLSFLNSFNTNYDQRSNDHEVSSSNGSSSGSSSNISSYSSSEYGESSGNDESIMRRIRMARGEGSKTVVSGPFCRLKHQKSLPSLIISEFTGCSNTLSSPYRVNPWNMMNVVETLDKIVYCQKGIFQEKRHHWSMDRAYLLSHSTVNWAKEFIMDLGILSERKKNDMLHFYNITFGIGPSLMDIRININSQHLSLNLLSKVYKKVDRVGGGLRLFLLDNEGTLTPDFRHLFDKINSFSNFGSHCGFGGGDEDKVGTGRVSRTGNSLLSLLGTHHKKKKEKTSIKPCKDDKFNLDVEHFHRNSCNGNINRGTGNDSEKLSFCTPIIGKSKSSSEISLKHPYLQRSNSQTSSLFPLSSRSNEETAFNTNSNCTSIEVLNMEGSITNTSIASILNNTNTTTPGVFIGDCNSNITSKDQYVGDEKYSIKCSHTNDASFERNEDLEEHSHNHDQEENQNHKFEDFYLTNEISCAPPVQVIEALKILCSSPKNVVIIFSGREKHLLDEWFGDIENIGLCAEHGYYLKLPKSIDPIHPNTWRQLNIESISEECLSSSVTSSSCSVMHSLKKNNGSEFSWYSPLKANCQVNKDEYNKKEDDKNSSVFLSSTKQQQLYNVSDWKNITLQLMEQYVLRTQGSYIENKGTALIFQLKYCEPYFGSWQAKELSNYLSELLINFPVNVISGNDYVEVRLQGINKGVAVQAILNQITSLSNKFGYIDEDCSIKRLQNPCLEMILCIGDDRSDEDMFSVVNHFSKTNKCNHNPEDKPDNQLELDGNTCSKSLKCEIFNVVIGKHTSLANYFLHSTEEVSDILQTLTLFT